MKSKIAGVALTAVMACGWASGAEASVVLSYFYINAVNNQNGSDFILFSFDKSGGGSGQIQHSIFDFNYPDVPLVRDNYDFYGASYEPIQLPPSQAGTLYLKFNYTSALEQISGSENGVYDGTTNYGPGYIDFEVRINGFDPDGKTLLGVNEVGPLKDQFVVIGFSEVPLPATAPLFGVALLTVGAAGYAARRVGGQKPA